MLTRALHRPLAGTRLVDRMWDRSVLQSTAASTRTLAARPDRQNGSLINLGQDMVREADAVKDRAQGYGPPASALNMAEPWAGFGVGIEQAVTLPASWYTSPTALQLEKQHVLYNTWQAVCSSAAVSRPGDFLCGVLGEVRYLLVRGEDGQLRAFHNVCRHHAAAVAQGCGNQPGLQFTCPYHGWTYDAHGRLVKATRLKGIKDFKATQFGLHPIAVDTWGHLVFIHLKGGAAAAAAGGGGGGGQPPPGVVEWLGAGGQRMLDVGMADSNLVHLTRREYVLNCNWKVFADNYLDGGYHVPFAHKDLSTGLALSGYTNELHEVLSIQRCAVKQPKPPAAESDGARSSGSSDSSDSNGSNGTASLDRLAGGRDAAYAFVFPNLMINRYGPWMDTNIVLPLTGSSTDRCRVIFDYWLDEQALITAAAAAAQHTTSHHIPSPSPSPPPPAAAAAHNHQSSSSSSSSNLSPGQVSAAVIQAALQSEFVQQSLASSNRVQEEDIGLCEAVQQGLQEPAYHTGRYAPGPEAPMYHFHSLLYSHVLEGCSRSLGNK